MCGIAGFSTPAFAEQTSAILTRMMQRIAHRGPDDRGTLIDSQVALGHQRLSIIDLSTGHQPMASSDEQTWIIFNGEIYNYIELRRDLIARGRTFRTQSDTEVILQMYDEYGDRCVEQLNGMFAFVIYDKRRQHLFAARDHFGIKPFYYTQIGPQFIFASEMKAILAHPAVHAQADPQAMTEYITLQLCLGNKTLFRGIQKLPPAHTLTLDLKTQTVQTREYWKPTYPHDLSISSNDAAAQLRELVRESVRIQLRSDVPVGAYLSGGLDSSTVACLGAEMTKGRFKTFTGGFRDRGPFDESAYAKAVAAAHPNIDYFEIFPDSRDFSSHIEKLIYHMDEPCAGPGLFPQYMVSQLASQHVKVVLGGQGGDEMFGGYARYFLLYLEDSFMQTLRAPWQLPQMARTAYRKRALLKAYAPSLRKLWKEGSVREPASHRYFRLLNRGEKALQFFSPDLMSPERITHMRQEFDELFNRPGSHTSIYEKMTHFDLRTLLPALLHVEDRVSMAVSLESRVPLLDYRIVDFLGRLSPDIKYPDGEMKYLFKQAVRPIVPDAVWNRQDKMGFPVPLIQWARGSLKDFLTDTLLSAPAKQRGVFQNDAVVKSLGQEQPFGRDLWGVLCLELWYRQLIDTSKGDKQLCAS